MGVRIPKIADVETAVRIFYENIEIGNEEIMTLFPGISRATARKLKGIVQEKMLEDEIPVFNALSVNTRVAYPMWGLDINELEGRLIKLRRLKLTREVQNCVV